MWHGESQLRVAGDGNCLYTAVRSAQRGQAADAALGAALRVELAEWIHRERAALQEQHGAQVVDAAWDRIVSGAWAEDEEVKLLSQMLGASIAVHGVMHHGVDRGTPVVVVYDRGNDVFGARPKAPVYHILNESNVHYSVLTRVSSS